MKAILFLEEGRRQLEAMVPGVAVQKCPLLRGTLVITEQALPPDVGFEEVLSVFRKLELPFVTDRHYEGQSIVHEV